MLPLIAWLAVAGSITALTSVMTPPPSLHLSEQLPQPLDHLPRGNPHRA